MIISIRAFKYLTPFVLFLLAIIAFSGHGIVCWLPLLYVFFVIPFVELLIRPDAKNLEQTEEELTKQNKLYDYILYLAVIIQYYVLYIFLNSLQEYDLSVSDIAGRVIAMGLLCGIFGINVAHELGHRVNKLDRTLAKALLLTSLYMHFYIEHNKGHHKNVATPQDPSSAKLNQNVFAFWKQTIIGTYKSAWHIDAKEMSVFQMIQITFLAVIYLIWGGAILGLFILAALIGALLLETVNYIEHYGLMRNKSEGANYERVQPHHSWNSNHVIGRLMLFELSRHSDHHYLASRKYQILRNIDNAPQMPTGYPGMILLSLCPPIWFKVMHGQMKKQGIIIS